eukprot:CAMPEP_0117420268 /NCGR_PEP_ID=MMETSP0758-20121206/1634_1 /TAXON_ID=63605 /ORGANISM="Percolomonas cosmopolitus, Strain AE-1 (ATCC 50343)" /LENGTH=414 /DNA_ID=CAMNT_0005201771 /DNA_START=165 /DNA_END=1409 /DNA_ORIENTATION=+
MRDCLFHPDYGYYSTQDNIFGEKGDFITAPEVSHLFGEMLGLWCYSEWGRFGCPDHITFVEVGPGKGTLMHDVLKTINQFKPISKVKKRAVLVEKSEKLQKVQKEKLHVASTFHAVTGKEEKILSHGRTEIHWHNEVHPTMFKEGSSLYDPKYEKGMVIILGNEIFDALPVHQFQLTEKGWCEVMVDVNESDDSEEHFKFVLSPGSTQNVFFAWMKEKMSTDVNRIEICPSAMQMVDAVQDVFGMFSEGGTSLFADYGYDRSLENHGYEDQFTLRGIKNHEIVHPLSRPGQVDLSAFVDFGILADRVSRRQLIHQTNINNPSGAADMIGSIFSNQPSNHVSTHVFPILSQEHFLQRMGFDGRFLRLVMNRQFVDDEHADHLMSVYSTLIHDMGHPFKFQCYSTKPKATGFFTYM